MAHLNFKQFANLFEDVRSGSSRELEQLIKTLNKEFPRAKWRGPQTNQMERRITISLGLEGIDPQESAALVQLLTNSGIVQQQHGQYFKKFPDFSVDVNIRRTRADPNSPFVISFLLTTEDGEAAQELQKMLETTLKGRTTEALETDIEKNIMKALDPPDDKVEFQNKVMVPFEKELKFIKSAGMELAPLKIEVMQPSMVIFYLTGDYRALESRLRGRGFKDTNQEGAIEKEFEGIALITHHDENTGIIQAIVMIEYVAEQYTDLKKIKKMIHQIFPFNPEFEI